MAEDKKQEPTVEIGATGLERTDGFINEEWLRQLTGNRATKIYREMSDNDPTVGAFIFAIEMLVRQVDWRVDAVSDRKEDIEAAEFLESCMNDMEHSWKDFITESLSMLIYGWSYHEIVYKQRLGDNEDESKKSKFDDGRIGWRKIPIRSQDSLWKWKYDEYNDDLAGMIQQPPPTYHNYFIPIDKALHFRTKRHKDNPEGRSLLRNAYRPWYFKKNIEEIEGIGIERDLAGLPVMQVPPEYLSSNATDAQKKLLNQMKRTITRVRRDEQEGMLIPSEEYGDSNNTIKTGFKFELMSSGGKRQFDTNEIINRYDKRILMTVLSGFLMLGQDKTGSFALASSMTDLFSLAIKAILDNIKDTFNKQAVTRLFELNSFNVEELPQINYGDIETPNLEEVGKFISSLTTAGISINDEDTENYLRNIANLPKKPENNVNKQSINKKDNNTDYTAEVKKLRKRIFGEDAEDGNCNCHHHD